MRGMKGLTDPRALGARPELAELEQPVREVTYVRDEYSQD